MTRAPASHFKIRLEKSQVAAVAATALLLLALCIYTRMRGVLPSHCDPKGPSSGSERVLRGGSRRSARARASLGALANWTGLRGKRFWVSLCPESGYLLTLPARGRR